MTNIIIDPEYCKGCFLCINYCPKKVLEKSSQRSTKGYIMPYAAKPEECTKCKTCELICPDLAVTVEEGAE
jgi:2-oxoglutarate ferredoxin oxidoreductase subunit delta